MTEAEFVRFLRYGGSKVAILAEIEYAIESGGVQDTETIYMSDRPEAVLGSQPYRSVIEKSPSVTRAVDLRTLGGKGARTIGELALTNTDGSSDFLLDKIVDGRDCEILIGGEGWARTEFRTLAVGTIASVACDGNSTTVALRDKNFLLDATVIGDPILTGPNAGKPRPICLGSVYNFDATPYLLDSTALTYYINNFALGGALPFTGAVLDVRDAGVTLISGQLFTFNSATMTAVAATDTLTRAGHGLAVNDVIYFSDTTGLGSIFAGLSGDTQYWVIATGLTLNDFKVSLTKGGAAVDITGAVMTGTWALLRRRFYVSLANATIELSSSPSGRITVDMQVHDAAGALTTGTPHESFKWLLDNYTQLESADYDAAAIATLVALETASILHGRAILDRTNVIDLLNEISTATDSWYTPKTNGVLTVGRFDLAALDSATAIDTIGEGDIDAERGVTCENLPLPFGRLIVDSNPNVVVQTDGLATSVTAANRALWGQKFQQRFTTTDPGTAGYLANWWDYHKSAQDSQPVPLAAFTDQTRVDATTALFKPWTRVYTLTVGIDKYGLNPGDCVTLTHPRYGLSTGLKCRVVSVATRPSDRAVDLVLVRQVTPDYTTVVH